MCAQTFAKDLGIPVVASQHTLFETYFDYYRLGWLRPLAEAENTGIKRGHSSAGTPGIKRGQCC